jgi:hypothetical protein
VFRWEQCARVFRLEHIASMFRYSHNSSMFRHSHNSSMFRLSALRRDDEKIALIASSGHFAHHKALLPVIRGLL